MMQRKYLFTMLTLLTVTLSFCLSNSAQAASSMKIFIFKDGSTLRGKILKYKGNSYIIQTKSGSVEIPKGQLQKIKSANLYRAKETPRNTNSLNTKGELNSRNVKQIPNGINFNNTINRIVANHSEEIYKTIFAHPDLKQAYIKLGNNTEIMKKINNPKLLNTLYTLPESRIQENHFFKDLFKYPEFQNFVTVLQKYKK